MNRWQSPSRIGNRTRLIVLCLACSAIICTSTFAQAETPRTWNDSTGKFSVVAELVEHDSESVLLKKPDGRQLTVAVKLLSKADQDYLATLAEKSDTGPQLGPATVYRLRIGLEIIGKGTATGVVGATPVPMEWPEQKVRIVDTDKTSNVQKVSYRSLGDGARQMVMTVPRLRAGDTARATVTFEVTRHGLELPELKGDYRVPQRVSRDLRHYLLPGPLTDSKDPNIIAAKEKAIAGTTDAWEQVQAIHGWVLDNVKYQERPEIKTAGIALQEKVGDCQELSSLFVAMCRAHGVPARCIWIPRHSYAEFYLEDSNGRGHWFPVESTNKQQFGFLPRTQVILQKGDNFRLPEFREPLHYARTTLKAADIKGAQPELKEVFEILSTTKGN